MRLQPIAALMMMAGLLPALGCWGGGMLGPEHGDPVGLWGPEMIAAPHPRFHAAPTRPVFAPSLVEFVDAAPPPEGFHPAIPPELLEPPRSEPDSRTPPPPTDAPSADMLDGLPEPGILPPPETPLPRASSRRVPGWEYF
jgi:hypothetical protein